MKFLYNIKEKGRFVLLLLLFLIIEILTSNSQTENISKLNVALNEIYSDRLIAQDYIYKMSENIHMQKVFLLTQNSSDTLSKVLNQSFNEITMHINNYEKTSLTNSEASLFKKLKGSVNGLKTFSTVETNHLFSSISARKIYTTQLDSISIYLKNLSEIQISRSQDLKNGSTKTVSFSNLTNDLSSVLLIIIALCIIAVVFTAKSTTPKFHQQEHLN